MGCVLQFCRAVMVLTSETLIEIFWCKLKMKDQSVRQNRQQKRVETFTVHPIVLKCCMFLFVFHQNLGPELSMTDFFCMAVKNKNKKLIRVNPKPKLTDWNLSAKVIRNSKVLLLYL